MAIEFTNEQTLAIETLDKSILVSAAAGSGKTAVLVERIMNIILEGKANVDEMLIVTFTKAAALEMRLRLAKRIRARMRECPEDSKRLKDQLSRLYRAYITTIDSFALRVIKEFFYETDIEPDFGTCDEVQGELMRREAAAELVEAGFEDDALISDSIGFREFLRLYSEERSEEKFKDDLVDAYIRLRSMPDYFNWAYRQAEELRVTPENFENSALHTKMAADAADYYQRAREAACEVRDLLYEAGLEEVCDAKLSPEMNTIESIYTELRNGNFNYELMDRMLGFTAVSFRPGKNYTEEYAPIKDEIKRLRDIYKNEIKAFNNMYLTPDLDTRLKEMNDTYAYTIYYIDLLKEFEKRYAAKKKERRVMDFADMEHNAVRILGNEEAADTLRRRFKFIFVDEYQDTNNIQEYLIGKVSRPDNVFKVGDLKQSIYKFRQAEPEIFERQYHKYSDPAEENGMAIDLSLNFRSNDATVRYINKVFETVMDGYDERSRLNTGCKCEPEYDFLPEVHILTDDAPEDQTEPGETIDEEIGDLSKAEAEAAYIADLAYGLIGTDFYDTKAKVVRKVEASDIVILLRAVKVNGDVVARALRAKGLESHVEEDDDYFDTVEVSIALALLTCIDNMKRDIPLITVLHSEVFGWSPSELAEIRIAHSDYRREHPAAGSSSKRAAYWEALEWYREKGPDDALRGKTDYAVSRILEWRRLSRMMPLEDFVWKVLTESGYYMMAGAMNGGVRRQANLKVLADRAGKYSRENVSTLSSYITFLDIMRKKKIKSGQTGMVSSDDNVIRISTIHKSKGLEYPFVIVGALGNRFRTDGLEKKFSFDSQIGVAMPYIDPSRKYWRSTLMQQAINAKSRRDSYREELRILYVAMTRARNKLILIGTCKSEEKLMRYTAKPTCFLEVMRDVLKTASNTYHISPLERKNVSESSSFASVLPDPDKELTSPESIMLYDEIERRFNYTYPYEDQLSSKAKYSVSELRRAALEAEAAEEAGEETEDVNASVHPSDDEVVHLRTAAENKKRASSADVGIAYHRIMEFIDFVRAAGKDGTPDADYIAESTEFLAGTGALDPDAYSSVDLERIVDFFRTDIGRRCADAAAAGTLRKEKAFTLRTENGAGSGRNILVQGVIDCCFEEAGEMVVVDYKSSFIRPGSGHEQELERIRHEYQVQIDLYSEAVMKGTGKKVKEAYLYLFATGEELRII